MRCKARQLSLFTGNYFTTEHHHSHLAPLSPFNDCRKTVQGRFLLPLPVTTWTQSYKRNWWTSYRGEGGEWIEIRNWWFNNLLDLMMTLLMTRIIMRNRGRKSLHFGMTCTEKITGNILTMAPRYLINSKPRRKVWQTTAMTQTWRQNVKQAGLSISMSRFSDMWDNGSGAGLSCHKYT